MVPYKCSSVGSWKGIDLGSAGVGMQGTRQPEITVTPPPRREQVPQVLSKPRLWKEQRRKLYLELLCNSDHRAATEQGIREVGVSLGTANTCRTDAVVLIPSVLGSGSPGQLGIALQTFLLIHCWLLCQLCQHTWILT